MECGGKRQRHAAFGGDFGGVFAHRPPPPPGHPKAVSRSACHRTPRLRSARRVVRSAKARPSRRVRAGWWPLRVRYRARGYRRSAPRYAYRRRRQPYRATRQASLLFRGTIPFLAGWIPRRRVSPPSAPGLLPQGAGWLPSPPVAIPWHPAAVPFCAGFPFPGRIALPNPKTALPQAGRAFPETGRRLDWWRGDSSRESGVTAAIPAQPARRALVEHL